MTATINVNAVATKDDKNKTIYERSIDFPMLKILQIETLADLAKELGEDYVMHQVKAQIKIAWRSKTRNLMEKRDDNGEFEFTDKALLKAHDVNWTPELRTTKTAEEKMLDMFKAMGDPAAAKALVDKFIAQQKK